MLSERILELIRTSDRRSAQRLAATINQMLPEEIREQITDATDYKSRHYLHMCALYRASKEIADIFLEHGARLADPDSAGNLPGHCAIECNATELVAHYSWKADHLLDEGNFRGDTQLHLCAGKRDAFGAEYGHILLSNGANPDVQRTNTLETPLHLSAGSGDERFAVLLLGFGARTELLDKYGLSPADCAVRNRHYHLADMIRNPEIHGISRPMQIRMKPEDTVQLIYPNGVREVITGIEHLTVLQRGAEGTGTRARRRAC